MDKEAFYRRAQESGAEFELRPAKRVVITGIAQHTSLGNTEQTWQGLLDGKSGARKLDINNRWVNLGAPVTDFDPSEHFDEKELRRGMTHLKALTVVTAREAAQAAGLLGKDGRLDPRINKRKVATWVGSGIANTPYLIDAHTAIHDSRSASKKDSLGRNRTKRLSLREGSGKIPSLLGLKIFPEELNAEIAMRLGLSGWGGSDTEACATGLANIAEAAESIFRGHNVAAVAGGVEDPYEGHPETGIGIFAAFRKVLSTRNEDPQRASRPFDRDRDGFVLGAGTAMVVLESEEHARERGAKILGEVLGIHKSMDGNDPTNIDAEVVRQTILAAMWDERIKDFHSDIDAIFAHATSTKEGDKHEWEVMKSIFGDDLKDIPITSFKGNVGHLAGGAGSLNVVNAVLAMNQGIIPHTLNLENPDPEFEGTQFVMGSPLRKEINKALILAYGFGGHNAVLVLGKYPQTV